MGDKLCLLWVYNRMQYLHDESPNSDYMVKLLSIIEATPDDKDTPIKQTKKSKTKAVKKL